MNTSRHKPWLSAAIVCAIVASALPASAQSNEEAAAGFFSSATGAVYLPFTTTTSVPTTSVAGTTVIIVMLISNKQPRALHMYLKENGASAREAIALGRGTGLDDLSTLFGVSSDNKDAFGRVLRTHRDELLDLIALRHGAELEMAQSEALARRTLALMQHNEALHGDITRLIVQYHTDETSASH